MDKEDYRDLAQALSQTYRDSASAQHLARLIQNDPGTIKAIVQSGKDPAKDLAALIRQTGGPHARRLDPQLLSWAVQLLAQPHRLLSAGKSPKRSPSKTSSEGNGTQELAGTALKYDELKRLAKAIAHLVEIAGGADLAAVNAGRIVEALLTREEVMGLLSALSLQSAIAAIKEGLTFQQIELAGKHLDTALSLYARRDGLIAHYRHGHSRPDELRHSIDDYGRESVPSGIYVYQTEDENTFKVISASKAREAVADGFKGVSRKQVELFNPSGLLAQIDYRIQRGWYSNFIDPNARKDLGLPVAAYRRPSQKFVSWEERVGGELLPSESE